MSSALTNSLVGPYLHGWGSDLPTRRHAEESRPDHQGRRVSAQSAIPFDFLSRCDVTARVAAPVVVATSAATIVTAMFRSRMHACEGSFRHAVSLGNVRTRRASNDRRPGTSGFHQDRWPRGGRCSGFDTRPTIRTSAARNAVRSQTHGL